MDRAELLQRGDLDELVQAITRAADRDDWDEVELLRRGCLQALETSGRQLWAPAAWAAYRLALDAPAQRAVTAMLAGHDRHTLGPLTEVVAQHHSWLDLVDHLPGGPVNAVVATERVARGEDLGDDDRAELFHLDVPGRWQPWEGPAPLATYRDAQVLAPAPTSAVSGDWHESDQPSGPELDRPVLQAALEAIADVWAGASTGRADVAIVTGEAATAVAALVPGVALVRRARLAEVVAALTWAAASGGARARRRGLAAGRSTTWWALRSLVDHESGGDPDDLEYDLDECEWLLFSDGDDSGWRLRVAMGHPDGWAMAIDAEDHLPDEQLDG